MVFTYPSMDIAKPTNQVSAMSFYQFLTDLSQNNNREWFEKNKAQYETARAEAEALVARCIAEIAKFEDLGSLKPKDTMFRIYRDVRFSKNKDPYKINFSALIGRSGRKEMAGYAYYVHFQPGESFMAAGVYEPTPEQLAKIRQEIDYNAAELKKIISDPGFVKTFGTMEGRQLKTAPKGYDKEHPEIDLLRYTQFYFSAKFEDKEVLAPDFPEKLAKTCLKIRPFLEFMNRALE